MEMIYMKSSLVDDILGYRNTKANLIREIVPIEDWVTSEYYVGPDATGIYSYWRDVIIDIFRSDRKPEDYIDQVIFTGSIGTGKTTIANIILMRRLYELSCYDRVAALFNLMSTKGIFFFYFNITKQQASKTGYAQLKSMLEQSPYFREHFPINPDKKYEIEFINAQLSVDAGARSSDTIGTDVIGSVLDEANFFSGDGGTASVTNAKDVQSKAAQLYTNTLNRARSRFLINGINYALSIVVSSSMYNSSFTNQLIETERDNKHTYIVDAKIWEVKPKGTYSDEMFYDIAPNAVICLSSCPPPTNFFIDSISTSQIKISWKGNEWNKYIISYSSQSLSNPDEGIIINITNAMNFTFTNLNYDYKYDVYIKADCGEKTSYWIGPLLIYMSYNMAHTGINSITTCSKIIYDSGGPNGNYGYNENSILTIYPETSGNFVSIKGKIDSEGNGDILYIYDGEGNSSVPEWLYPSD